VNRLLAALRDEEERSRCVAHVDVAAATLGRRQAWPGWTPVWVREGYARLGVELPWTHQVEAMEAARAGHTVIATSAGSGKSAALWTPVLTALDAPSPLGRITEVRAKPSALYLAPTKALAADQLAGLEALFRAADSTGLMAATCDGDTPVEARRFLQSHVDILLTNPDLLHFSLLPGHARWAGFLRGLRYVIVDELHAYRGVMGAHVAWVLRRLRRLCAHYGADPVFLTASATVSQPAATAARLIDVEEDQVAAVTVDTAERGERTLVFWRPAAEDGDDGARRSAAAEAARLLADLTDTGARTVAFVRSRHSAESVAAATRSALGGVAASRVATYRGGYLPEERRDLEKRLRNGSLLGLVSTSALELGIDVAGLDAVLIAGWPGTMAALRQQAGRCGRAGEDGLAVWIAGADPLDCYVAAHPETVVGAPLEATAFDPANPYVMAPHLAAAAAELPITQGELPRLGPGAKEVLDSLAEAGAVRRRGERWYWILPERATDLTDLRGSGGGLVQLVENATGRVLGTVDAGRAPAVAHPGAVYVHQGETFTVTELDIDGGVALVEEATPRYRTMPLDASQVSVVETRATAAEPAATWHFGLVDVTSQVTGYMRLRVPGLSRIDTRPLDMPAAKLRTAATWVSIPEETLRAASLTAEQVPSALHAAEHAAIGLLPLLATCDRWDLGGLSAAQHPDTGEATIFIHDAVQGGAGFAERAFHRRTALLRAVRNRLVECRCEDGCPSCVQSPKCGNANQVLSKDGALSLVTVLLPAGPDTSPGDVT
jgi:DEAD/DEAH box helicase domain-containing protein